VYILLILLYGCETYSSKRILRIIDCLLTLAACNKAFYPLIQWRRFLLNGGGTGVWGRSPQRGPGAEPLVRGSGSTKMLGGRAPRLPYNRRPCSYSCFAANFCRSASFDCYTGAYFFSNDNSREDVFAFQIDRRKYARIDEGVHPQRYLS